MSLAWTIRLSSGAKKSLQKLSKPIAKRIVEYIHEKIENNADPREYGKTLKGELSELWMYRIGDYRIICSIDDGSEEVIVLRIGQRKEVYKGKG